MQVAILPLCRPTFDVELAAHKFSGMLKTLARGHFEIVGKRELLTDAGAASQAMDDLEAQVFDQLLVLQVTFTDASTISEAASRFPEPISIWAVKEPRSGGRLRLNSFCGLNLASHSLGLANRPFSWLYSDPSQVTPEVLSELFSGRRASGRLDADAHASSLRPRRSVVPSIRGSRIGLIGTHPDGFDTCVNDSHSLKEIAEIEVAEIPLDELFARARHVPQEQRDELRSETAQAVSGLREVDEGQLNRSLALRVALDQIRAERRLDAFAIRCWPETFTEYGGAICGPASMLGELLVPCACEADVFGAFSQLILQRVAGAPVFLADIVDMDQDDDSGVVWHCGQAPRSMCDPDERPVATIHSNRKMPLLFEFPLRPGRVTLMRISRAFDRKKMVLAGGRIIRRPLPYSGTSGVVRFERPTANVLTDIIASGLEHHVALTYGEHRAALRELAAEMSLPVLEI